MKQSPLVEQAIAAALKVPIPGGTVSATHVVGPDKEITARLSFAKVKPVA
jgi:hypothetical protein